MLLEGRPYSEAEAKPKLDSKTGYLRLSYVTYMSEFT